MEGSTRDSDQRDLRLEVIIAVLKHSIRPIQRRALISYIILMSKPSDITTTLSYAITGIAAVFGMYNAIIFLFYSQKTTNTWTMLLCFW